MPRREASVRHRRGTAYVLAVGLAMLVAAVAIGTLLAVRARFAGTRDSIDLSNARCLAESGLEWGIHTLNTANAYAEGTVPATSVTRLDFTAGSVRVGILQDAADADATTLTPALIKVGATVGVAARRYQVRAHPIVAAIEAFEHPIVVGGKLDLDSDCHLTVSGEGVGLAGAVERAVGATVTGSIHSVALGNADPDVAMQRSLDRVALPTVDHLNALVAAATTLTVAGGGAISFDHVLLSPTANPYGQLNQRGLYVLDCANRTITITESRIVGTLLLLNPGAGSKLTAPVALESAVRGAPALVVKGNLSLDGSDGRIDENGVNLNPQGTPRPFVGGTADEDTTDRFGATLDGPIIVFGNLSVSATTAVRGLIVTGDCTIDGKVDVERDDWSAWAPPAELRATRWRLDRATLTEIDVGP